MRPRGTRFVCILKLLMSARGLGTVPKEQRKNFPLVLSSPLLRSGVPSPMTLRSDLLSQLPGWVARPFSEEPRYTQ